MNCNGDCLRCELARCLLDDTAENDFSALTAADYRAAEIEAALDTRTPRQKAIAAKQRAYREENREAIAAKQRAYYEENREAIAAKQRRLRDARRARGYTQAALGKLIGVSQPELSLWETGAIPADWDRLIPVLPELAQVKLA